jgi:hypothetical protein
VKTKIPCEGKKWQKIDVAPTSGKRNPTHQGGIGQGLLPHLQRHWVKQG